MMDQKSHGCSMIFIYLFGDPFISYRCAVHSKSRDPKIRRLLWSEKPFDSRGDLGFLAFDWFGCLHNWEDKGSPYRSLGR